MKAIQERELGGRGRAADETGPSSKTRFKKTQAPPRKPARRRRTSSRSLRQNVSDVPPRRRSVRNYLDWLLVDSVEQERPRVKKDLKAAADRSSITITSAWRRSRSASSSISPCSSAPKQAEVGPILCLVGTRPGVRQDLARQVESRRPTGRDFRCECRFGGLVRRRGPENPWSPPPHLHRLDARQDYPVECGRRSPRIRCFLLDEVTRWAPISRGDPSSGFCSRCLTPSKNHTFADPLSSEVDYRILSHVMFITTANHAQHIPPPFDGNRMGDHPESLGYTEDEKGRDRRAST